MKPAYRASTLVLSLAALAAPSLSGCAAEPLDEETGSAELAAAKGNGAPSGPHYNLNIIGVPNDKSANMNGPTGGRIFVRLEGSSKILLEEHDDFQVFDANGTDGEAVFGLPNPDPDGDGVTAYSVYARALGTPGGSSASTTCMEDAEGTWCSTRSMVLVRSTGGSSFKNVSRELLTVCGDWDGDGQEECDGVFSDDTMDYFWQYDNNGLRLAQCRFYPESTDTDP